MDGDRRRVCDRRQFFGACTTDSGDCTIDPFVLPDINIPSKRLAAAADAMVTDLDTVGPQFIVTRCERARFG